MSNPKWSDARRKAGPLVAKAIKAGKLMPIAECTCVDCGDPAHHYDHRDYEKPLEVDPVCRSCNYLRGSGLNAFKEVEEEEGTIHAGIRLPKDMMDSLREISVKEGRSTSGMIRWVLKQYLKSYK